MAADMSKMSCAAGGGFSLGSGASPDGGSASDDSPGSPMATDRRTSGGSASTPEVATLAAFQCTYPADDVLVRVLP